ncbi:MAG: response regulator transcription factor [Chloroflexi bacterium]|nr:response regulator transcription factor [Chloroflexota bacterium]
MTQIRILVVDDHQIVRQGIRSLLSNYPEFKIVGEAADGMAALNQVRQLTPDVTLLDIRMPGESGLEVLRQIRQVQPEARVLMLTSFDDEEYVLGALRAGAHGFVLKSVSDEMLVQAIHSVCRGERTLSPQITEQVVRWVTSKPSELIVEKTASFAEDDQHILRLLVEGASNTDIAGELYISHTTLKRKLRKIFTKMNVQTRAQAAAEAVRRGLA